MAKKSGNGSMQRAAAERKGAALKPYPKFSNCLMPDGSACAGVGKVEVVKGKPSFRCGRQEEAPQVTPRMSRDCTLRRPV